MKQKLYIFIASVFLVLGVMQIAQGDIIFFTLNEEGVRTKVASKIEDLDDKTKYTVIKRDNFYILQYDSKTEETLKYFVEVRKSALSSKYQIEDVFQGKVGEVYNTVISTKKNFYVYTIEVKDTQSTITVNEEKRGSMAGLLELSISAFIYYDVFRKKTKVQPDNLEGPNS